MVPTTTRHISSRVVFHNQDHGRVLSLNRVRHNLHEAAAQAREVMAAINNVLTHQASSGDYITINAIIPT
jgi:translation initiation factor IF-2